MCVRWLWKRVREWSRLENEKEALHRQLEEMQREIHLLVQQMADFQGPPVTPEPLPDVQVLAPLVQPPPSSWVPQPKGPAQQLQMDENQVYYVTALLEGEAAAWLTGLFEIQVPELIHFERFMLALQFEDLFQEDKAHVCLRHLQQRSRSSQLKSNVERPCTSSTGLPLAALAKEELAEIPKEYRDFRLPWGKGGVLLEVYL
uniref:Uncharacterized protein n=1 Tax=Sphaerodactylus townsendi TaxID=933632 RepID=A0ACB8FBV2_9SAUR